MRWALRKIDSLFATVMAAVVGLAASQLELFIQYYLQRLGGHLDEARLTVRLLLDGQPAASTAKQMIAAAAETRVAALASAHDAIAHAGVLTKPVVFFIHMNRDIALATAKEFQPGVPLDTAGIAYGVAGMIVAWLIYDVVRGLVSIPFRRRAARTASQI